MQTAMLRNPDVETPDIDDRDAPRDEVAASRDMGEDGPEMNWEAKYLDRLGQDISDLKADIRDLNGRLTDAFNKLDAKLEQKVSELRLELEQKVSGLRVEMKELRVEMKEGFAKVDERFSRTDERLAKMEERFSTWATWCIGLIVTVILGVVTLIVKLFL